jgi:6-phosphogluconolactonase/glucosamine-6-phosphate isomerase/deaminase
MSPDINTRRAFFDSLDQKQREWYLFDTQETLQEIVNKICSVQPECDKRYDKRYVKNTTFKLVVLGVLIGMGMTKAIPANVLTTIFG